MEFLTIQQSEDVLSFSIFRHGSSFINIATPFGEFLKGFLVPRG